MGAMAGIKTLPLNTSHGELREEIAFTMVRCEARPLTEALAPPLATFFPRIQDVMSTDWQLTLDVMRAEARVIVLDERLDTTVDAIVSAILVITGGDRTHWLYVLFLGTQQPAELKAPILGEELETLEKVWLPELGKTPFPTLSAFTAVLKPQVEEARTAETALAVAKQALTHFRSEQGACGALVADINSARKGAHGQLGVIAHANPLALLPTEFPESFFQLGRAHRKLTADELVVRLAQAKTAVEVLQARLEEARADELKKANKRATREAARRQKKLGKAEKKAADAQAEVDALKGEPTDPEPQPR